MRTSSLLTLLAAALLNLRHVHAFSFMPSAIQRVQLSNNNNKLHATREPMGEMKATTKVEPDSYMGERGAFVSIFTLQDIPLSLDQFWSAFDDYLPLQKSFSGHGETWLELGGGKPTNGPGAEVGFALGGGKPMSGPAAEIGAVGSLSGDNTYEVLWQKDDLNHIWVMGTPKPNHFFSYYRCTVSAWKGDDTPCKARLAIEGVVIGHETNAERLDFVNKSNDYLPIRIQEICDFILHRDGLNSRFEVELDYPIEKYWKVVSGWDDISWVKGAEKVEQLGDDVRRLTFSGGSQLEEKLVSSNDETKTLVYRVLTGSMSVKMYEGTVKLTSNGPNKTLMTYDNIYLPNDDIDPVQFKAGIDASFTARGEWMKETFHQ